MHASESLRFVAQNSPEVNAGLAEIRRATAKFHDYTKAIEAGYTVWAPNPLVSGSSCPASSEGKMGYHLVNVSLRGGRRAGRHQFHQDDFGRTCAARSIC